MRQPRRLALALTAALLVVGCVGLRSQPAAAHVLRTDGPAASVMHIEPDDNPVANRDTTITFDFSDSQSSFSLRDYRTEVTTSADGQVSRTVPLAIDYNRIGHSVVHFGPAAIYELHLKGEPIREGQGQAFDISYEIRVTGNTNSVADSASAQTIILVSLAVFCILALIARQQIIAGGRYRPKADPKKRSR